MPQAGKGPTESPPNLPTILRIAQTVWAVPRPTQRAIGKLRVNLARDGVESQRSAVVVAERHGRDRVRTCARSYSDGTPLRWRYPNVPARSFSVGQLQHFGKGGKRQVHLASRRFKPGVDSFALDGSDPHWQSRQLHPAARACLIDAGPRRARPQYSRKCTPSRKPHALPGDPPH